MNTQRVAITMPARLIKNIDMISREKGVSRSRFIALALAEKIDGEKKRLLKEAYDRIFSDEKILKEQVETAKWFEGAGSEGGQEW
jgi:metal-responsive CopG/Arc/MetJ family transcriptional regulator